jgi:RNA polymerase sigma-70 factor (ECF subfamily)
MEGNAEWTDGDVARTIAARTPGSAEAAESELYRRFAPRVRLYGLRHLRNDDAARDLAQQVLLVAIEKLRNGSVRDADQIASFILGMSRLMTKDLKRQEWRRETLREAFIPPSAFTVDVEDASLDLDRLEACLAMLAERDRAVVMLTFYAGRTASDVGRELGVSEGNVRVSRHRAVQRLRACVMSGATVA